MLYQIEQILNPVELIKELSVNLIEELLVEDVGILKLIKLHLVHLKQARDRLSASHRWHHLHHQKIVFRVATRKQVINLYCALTQQILHQCVGVLLLIALEEAVAL